MKYYFKDEINEEKFIDILKVFQSVEFKECIDKICKDKLAVRFIENRLEKCQLEEMLHARELEIVSLVEEKERSKT